MTAYVSRRVYVLLNLVPVGLAFWFFWRPELYRPYGLPFPDSEIYSLVAFTVLLNLLPLALYPLAKSLNLTYPVLGSLKVLIFIVWIVAFLWDAKFILTPKYPTILRFTDALFHFTGFGFFIFCILAQILPVKPELQTITVKLDTGEIGQINAADFDPETMEKL